MKTLKPETRPFIKPITNEDHYRVPPQDLEAEQSVLGAMLLVKEAVDIASEILVEDDFYREAHRKLFRAILNLHERKEPVDLTTLTTELRKMGDFEIVGGISAMSSLIDRVPTAANAEYYAKIVKEKACSRGLIIAATSIVADAYADSMPVLELMDGAEARIWEATERRETKGFKQIGDFIGDVCEQVMDLADRQHHVTGIPFGFDELDIVTQGAQNAELIIIGARPSVGKTALCLNMAWNMASGLNELGEVFNVGMFSLEMTEKQLAKRLLCSVSKVNWRNAMKGDLRDSDRTNLMNASNKIHAVPLHINDSDSLTVLQLKAQARRLKKIFDIDVLIIDYLQLIQAGIRCDTREQEVAYISRNLKSLAKSLNIPVIVLSQLSRGMKGAAERKPVLSDLRESGSLEQDADVVIFIHREGELPNFNYELIVAKQRNGPVGTPIPIKFNSWNTQFESMPKPETREKTAREAGREWAG